MVEPGEQVSAVGPLSIVTASTLDSRCFKYEDRCRHRASIISNPITFTKSSAAEIADRMEFYAETMDQQAIEQEMTRSLEEVVRQARDQMK